MTQATDPLRASLAEQAMRLRGPGELPAALLDLARVSLTVGGEEYKLVRPRDWEELRHQEGAEGRSAPYWAIAWPSGLELAEALTRLDLGGRRVLELGCGLGLPSLVAARRGANVTATDGAPDAVAFTAHNLALNGLEGEAALVDWREPDALTEGAPWDVVVAADVLYLRHNVAALLRMLPRLVSAEGAALVADPSRAGAREFLAAARAFFSVETRASDSRENVVVHTLRRRR